MKQRVPIVVPVSGTVRVQLQARPETLEIDLHRTAVMIIDMQNGYVSKGGFFDLCGFDVSQYEKIIEPIKVLADTARSKGYRVIYVVTRHPADMSDSGGPDSALWHKDFALTLKREHPEWEDKFTFRDTWGAEVIEELKPQEGDIISEKMRMTAFFQTNLDTVLKTYNIKYLICTGIATNVCVEATLRDAYYLGYFPILVSDAVMNIGPDFTQEAMVYNIEAYYGWVVTTEDCIRAMKTLSL